MQRCPWPGNDEKMIRYHDKEWGVPVHNDRKMFEFIILEVFQAGLSWAIVMKKREAFRKAFAGFDARKVARFSRNDIEKLLRDEGIIRNRMKIEAAVNNAQRVLEAKKEYGSFSKYLWNFVDGPIVNKWKNLQDIPAKTEKAEEISKDMKKRGFSFVGPTVIYAHMQAVGMVNDHLVSCYRYRELMG